MPDEPFRDALNRMLADAYADMQPPTHLGEAFGGPHVEPQPTITVAKSAAYLMLSVDQQLDAGLITEEEARARGWTPPPPPSRRARLRWRWQAWRERTGRKIGSWLAGVDLSERDEDW